MKQSADLKQGTDLKGRSHSSHFILNQCRKKVDPIKNDSEIAR